uniref:Uncharacterized protein n=1 Tax=Anguilla anguilla TaxID=7936 RepID=A0A0E9UTP0_ANGAN
MCGCLYVRMQLSKFCRALFRR